MVSAKVNVDNGTNSSKESSKVLGFMDVKKIQADGENESSLEPDYQSSDLAVAQGEPSMDHAARRLGSAPETGVVYRGLRKSRYFLYAGKSVELVDENGIPTPMTQFSWNQLAALDRYPPDVFEADEGGKYNDSPSYFQSIEQARKYREQIAQHRNPFDPTIAEVRQNQLLWISRLYRAMIDVSDAQDSLDEYEETSVPRKRSPKGWKEWAISKKFDQGSVEAACWLLLETCLDYHENGRRLMHAHCKIPTDDDYLLDCRQRMEKLEQLLRQWKLVCTEVLCNQDVISKVIAPTRVVKSKKTNEEGNRRKREMLATAQGNSTLGHRNLGRPEQQPSYMPQSVRRPSPLFGVFEGSYGPVCASYSAMPRPPPPGVALGMHGGIPLAYGYAIGYDPHLRPCHPSVVPPPHPSSRAIPPNPKRARMSGPAGADDMAR